MIWWHVFIWIYWDNNEAFACKCIYRKNKNNEFYAEHCVADATEGMFFQYLNVLISKQNNAVVCLSILCLKRIFDKIMKPLLLPREIEYVCLGFVYCFNKIYKLFYDMNALNMFFNKDHCSVCWLSDICNECMVYLMTSIKSLMQNVPKWSDTL